MTDCTVSTPRPRRRIGERQAAVAAMTNGKDMVAVIYHQLPTLCRSLESDTRFLNRVNESWIGCEGARITLQVLQTALCWLVRERFGDRDDTIVDWCRARDIDRTRFHRFARFFEIYFPQQAKFLRSLGETPIETAQELQAALNRAPRDHEMRPLTLEHHVVAMVLPEPQRWQALDEAHAKRLNVRAFRELVKAMQGVEVSALDEQRAREQWAERAAARGVQQEPRLFLACILSRLEQAGQLELLFDLLFSRCRPAWELWRVEAIAADRTLHPEEPS